MPAKKKSAANRFGALRELRQQRSENDIENEDNSVEELVPAQSSPEVASKSIVNDTPQPTDSVVIEEILKDDTEPALSEPRRRGRPPGRRSDPDYTQITAYVPLDLLLEIQGALRNEQTRTRKRVPRPVSDLVEQLLKDWLSENR